VKLAVLDTVLVAAACLIPAASHLFAVPLYVLNPMLALLLTGVIFGRDWRNALMLAVLMPLVSSLLTGMPAAPKMVCMMAELATVATMFGVLSRRWKVLPAVLVSVVAAKGVYYGLKAMVLAPAVLVGTEWWMQLLAVALWGGLFAAFYKRMR
jgi:niacin transporter